MHTLRASALLAFLALLLAASIASAQPTHQTVEVGHITGIIDPAMATYVDRVITSAEHDQAQAVVFDVDTPGGVPDATREINSRIKRSKVPILFDVGPSGAANLQASDASQQYVATDLPDLLRQADGASVDVASGPVTLHTANAPTQPADMSAIESFLHTITNPTIAYILLSMGSLGLLLELYNPGSVLPGVIGGVCLLLAFYALGTLPVNFTGLALLGFGLLLFALEPHLTAHGILAAGGAIAFVLGSMLLINAQGAPFLQVSNMAIGGVTGVLLAFFLVLITAVLRSRHRRAVTGHEGLIGAVGTVRREIEPGRAGYVLVQGELWRALSPDGRLHAGESIIVHGVDGLVLTVRRASDRVPAPPRPPSPALAKSNRARI